MMPTRRLVRLSAALSLVLLASCQQPKPPSGEQELLTKYPPAAGSPSCPVLPPDWLERLSTQERRILPTDCETLSRTPQFSWGEARDRQVGSPWTFMLRNQGGAAVLTRTDLSAPRFLLDTALPPGDYEWSVTYSSTRGLLVPSQWRRFKIADTTAFANRSLLASQAPAASSPAAISSGASLATSVMAKARPRLLPAGSSYATLAAAARSTEHLPVLTKLRDLARYTLSRPVPAAPATPVTATELAKVQGSIAIWQEARREREYIEMLALIGRLDSSPALISNAKLRLMSLAAWSPTGVSGEKINDQANREIYAALALGMDMLWPELSGPERSQVTASLRSRLLLAAESLAVLDRSPYDSHANNNIRWVNQALLLSAGLPGFPEAPEMLSRYWDLSLFTLSALSGSDGGFGNGIAYGWYTFVVNVPYVAAVRSITGIDLYQFDHLRRAGDQLIAFTAPNSKQPSAFGDGLEVQEHYAHYSSAYFRLHAQMTRSAQDAWYWQANPANISAPSNALIWQLLLLGVDKNPLPSPVAPAQNTWFFPDTGLAAMHVDAKQSARTSVFFRSSRFGSYGHSHADNNSVVYTSEGLPLLINAGYYPYYNSPHHKNIRATRFKNALTFDGGYGQSENLLSATKPSDPIHTMDARGEVIRTETRGSLSLVTGDATAAYRGYSTQTYTWTPLLSNAVRSVVMDRANGVTLIYDWATSNKPRQWELNYHSPNAFAADAATVRASNGRASVCLDRYGPASSFSQTSTWQIAPEVAQPAQAHGRFTVLSPSLELAHLTVLRDGCKIVPVQVAQQGSRISVVIGNQNVSFDKRQTLLSP